MSSDLVIVIPFYKKRFFEQTLDSLARQTCRRFTVFIGDDASPDEPTDIIRGVEKVLSIRYKRFQDNLGRFSPARHWNRCVLETDSEWVWLFSDDDIADPLCVESFSRELKEAPHFDLYRFQKGIVDDDGCERGCPLQPPPVESAEDLVLSRFVKARSMTIPEHIFSRKAFDREAGFVDFPLAWCSDDATWAAFARVTGVKTIRGGRVLWRTGRLNLSARNQNTSLKVEAFELYLKWLQSNFRGVEFQSALKAASREWFPYGFSLLGDFVPLRALLRFWVFFNKFTGRWEWRMLMRMLRMNHVCFYHLRKMKRCLSNAGGR